MEVTGLISFQVFTIAASPKSPLDTIRDVSREVRQLRKSLQAQHEGSLGEEEFLRCKL